MKRVLKRFFIITITATRRLFSEKYTYRVSALSFETTLAIIPIISLSVFLITFFPFFSKLIYLTEEYILQNFIPDAANKIEIYFENFIQHAVHLPLLSIVFLIFTGIMMVNTIDETLNDIWQIKIRRKIFLAWIIYWFIILLTPLLIGLSVFITTSVLTLYGLSHTGFILAFCIPVFINTILFSAIYIFSPHVYVKLRDGLFGGFLAAVLFEIARLAFSYYIKQFSNYEIVYGAFAIIPIFLIWIYIGWFIILWGAIFTHTFSLHNPKFSS